MHSNAKRVVTVAVPVLGLLALANFAGSPLFGESGPRATFVSLPSKALSESGSRGLERLPLINDLEIKRETTTSLTDDPVVARPKPDVLRLKLVAESSPSVRSRTSVNSVGTRSRHSRPAPVRLATKPVPNAVPTKQPALPLISPASTDLQPNAMSGTLLEPVKPTLVDHLFRPRHNTVAPSKSPFPGAQVERKQAAPVIIAVSPIPTPDASLSESVQDVRPQPVVVAAPAIRLPRIVEEVPAVDAEDKPDSDSLIVDASELFSGPLEDMEDLTDTPVAFPVVNPFEPPTTRTLPWNEPKPAPMVIPGFAGTKIKVRENETRDVVRLEQLAVDAKSNASTDNEDPNLVIPPPSISNDVQKAGASPPSPTDELTEPTNSVADPLVEDLVKPELDNTPKPEVNAAAKSVEEVAIEAESPILNVEEPESPTLTVEQAESPILSAEEFETPGFSPILEPRVESSEPENVLPSTDAPVIPEETLDDTELPVIIPNPDDVLVPENPASDSTSSWNPVDLKSVELNANKRDAEMPEKATEAIREDRLLARKAVLHGFELAQRRAKFSARARFIETLRIVARSLDEQSYGTNHSKALRNALNAYDETADFFPRSYRPDEDVNLHMAIEGHNTKLLEHADPDLLTPNQCAREYLAYAEQEFVAALGKDAFGAQALYGLGRLESSVETTASNAEMLRAHRSMVLYQAALRVDPKNFAAANELGVLLARYGKHEEAIAALKHCLAYSSQSTAWMNLASIYGKTGRTEEARFALAQAGKVRGLDGKMPFIANRPRVEWVDPMTFATAPQLAPNTPVQPLVTNQPVEARPIRQGAIATRPVSPEPTRVAQPGFQRPTAIGPRVPAPTKQPTHTATRPKPRYFGFGR